MFSALPIVATDVGNISETLGGTGLVVPPADPSQLATALLSLLEHPESGYKNRTLLGKAAQKRALSLYTTKQAVNRFKSIYQSILHERSVAEMHIAAAI